MDFGIFWGFFCFHCFLGSLILKHHLLGDQQQPFGCSPGLPPGGRWPAGVGWVADGGNMSKVS